MAALQSKTAQTEATGKNSLRNEIIAIALFALGVLLLLCLLSYKPGDPSWNSASTRSAQNWIGYIGANVSVTLFQLFGLAAAMLPVLLLLVAWRRFRTIRIQAPIWRGAGLVLLIICGAGLLGLFVALPVADKSFNAGGVVGAFAAHLLAAGLNTVGATICLVALSAIAILLATNFSFAGAIESLLLRRSDSTGSWFKKIAERYASWVAERRRFAAEQRERRAAARATLVSAESTAPDPSRPDGSTLNVALVENGAPGLNAAPGSRSIGRRRTSEPADLADPAAPAAVQAGATSTSKEPDAGKPVAAAASASSPAATAASRSAAKDEAGTIAEMIRTASVVRSDPPAAEPDAQSSIKSALPVRTTGSSVRQEYALPGVEFLQPPPPHSEQADSDLLEIARKIAEKCAEFNVRGQVMHIRPGPVVTNYEFKPDPGVKYNRVTGLVDDLCLALEAESVRIDRMPGKSHVGIEVPNPVRETIHLREVVESRAFQDSPSKITIALGKTIDGLNYITDLAKMPHLLIAGATGAGKSVGVNSLVVSILYKAKPDEVKFILVDPKRLELGLYADIPHLATPIITDPKRAAISLKWAVSEMERRYKELAGFGVRNIDGFNQEMNRRNLKEELDENGAPYKTLPYIVIIIDELADLMMVSSHDVEESITRLAQMARAVGIHLVLATQRPSVDVITGLIKANFPSRVSFRVSSKVDSRTIIDANGAEQLLGRGDMLFLPPGTSRLIRVHGAYVDEQEIGRIVAHVKQQCAPAYDESITQTEDEALGLEEMDGDRDQLFEEALRICVEMKRASTSVLQRRLRVGYGRAAAILDRFEREGMIGPIDGARPRAVLGRAFELVSEWDAQSDGL